MGAKYTEYITREHALEFLRETLEKATDSTLADLVEVLNDDPYLGRPLGLCNFIVTGKVPPEEYKKEFWGNFQG